MAPIIKVQTAKVALVDLQKQQEAAVASAVAEGIPVESGINVRENYVELFVAERSRFDEARGKGRISISPNVKVITVSSMGKEETILYGGSALTTCTAGFAVKNWWGTKGITTAGHCDDTQRFNGTNLPLYLENDSGAYDIQWHGYSDVTNKVLYLSGTINITSRLYRAYQALGAFVCKYGMTTYFTCGLISDKNFTWDGSATYIYVDNDGGYPDDGNLSSNGDSGAPWYTSAGVAYGSHEGSPGVDPNDAVYMAVDYLEWGLGVSIMTTP